MKKLKLLSAVILVGIIVAFVYFGFEYAVHHSITYIWDTVFDTETKRFLVIPLGVVITLLFFGFQHYLDPKSENKESHGLGGDGLKPTLGMLATILFIGYFSLIAGASLGPEAVLVPACMVVGTLAGVKLFKNEQEYVKALAAAGFIALFAAFFHSFAIGFLAIFLVSKQAKVKITSNLVIVAVLASGSATLVLNVIDPEGHYFNFPEFSWKVVVMDAFIGIFLIAAGFLATFGLKYSHTAFEKLRNYAKNLTWWKQALLASLGLSILYLLGGTLVQFTGNESIAPMFSQAASLGFIGLLWILIVKITAIAWSKAMGYRGGLVFPMIFVASVLTAIAQIFYKDLSLGVGFIATMVGILAAETKAKILF